MLTGHPPGKAVCMHKIVGVSQVFAAKSDQLWWQMTKQACIAGPYDTKLIYFGQLDPGPANLVRYLLLDTPSLRYTARDIANHFWVKQALQLGIRHQSDCSYAR